MYSTKLTYSCILHFSNYIFALSFLIIFFHHWKLPVLFYYRIIAGQIFAAPLKNAEMQHACFGIMLYTFWVALSFSPLNEWTAIMSWRIAGIPNWDPQHLETAWLPVPQREKFIHLAVPKSVRTWLMFLFGAHALKLSILAFIFK